MNTRIEIIKQDKYCAYCGKLLQKHDDITVWCSTTSRNYCGSELQCDCEKAKLEISLSEQLKKLYNSPISDNLIEMKVEEYRNKLLNKNDEFTKSTSITSVSNSSEFIPPEYQPFLLSNHC